MENKCKFYYAVSKQAKRALLLAACLPAVPQCVWLICLILRLNKQQKEKERERERELIEQQLDDAMKYNAQII